MVEKISFAIEDAEIIEDLNNSQFATAKLTLFSSGTNRNGFYCSEEVLRNAATSAYEKPIIFEVNETFGDFGSHNPKRTTSAGFIVPQTGEFVRQADGRLSFVVLGKIWKHYSGKFLDIFKFNAKTKSKLSVEMELLGKSKREDGYFEMKNFVYAAACILGDMVTEASKGANIQMLTFSENDEQEFKKALDLEFSKKEEIIVGELNNTENLQNELEEQEKPKDETQVDNAEQQEKPVEVDNAEEKPEEKPPESSDGESQEDMGCGDKNMAEEPEKPKEDEKPEEEKPEDEKPEGDKEEKEEDMSLSLASFVDKSTFLSLFDSEGETHKSLSLEFEKGFKDVQIGFVLKEMFAKVVEYKEKCKDFELLSSENEGLKKFKQEIDLKDFEHVVNAVLKEIENKVQIPTEEVELLKLDAENFNLDNIDIWTNKAKAKALDFAMKNSEKDDEYNYKRFGLKDKREKVKANKSPWPAQK